MENTNQNQIICSVCGKIIQPLGIESKIRRSHEDKPNEFGLLNGDSIIEISEFKEDKHLACRVMLAKYSVAGLSMRWLSPDKFVVTSNNKAAYDCIANMKMLSYEEMRRCGVYLYGQPGTGKTHLLASLFRELIVRGATPKKIAWVNTSSMLTKIRSSFGKKYNYGEESEQEAILEKLKTPILFVDDIGTESATPWATEILYDAINYRYEEKLPTFISSNLSLQELANRLGDKFASRVIEMCKPIRVEGDDWRLTNADKRDQNNNDNHIGLPDFSYVMAGWDIYEEYKRIIKAA